MRRLLAVTAIATAIAAPAAAHAGYARECTKTVQLQCSGRVCPTDCWTRDCLVWVDVFGDSNTAQCVSPIVVS